MPNIFLIGDADSVLGFRFAGIRGHVAKDASAAAELFRQAFQDREVSIVVISERVASLIRSEVDALTAKRDSPFVVEIADSAGPLPTRKTAPEIVRDAIGITI